VFKSAANIKKDISINIASFAGLRSMLTIYEKRTATFASGS
jgi:hypothetical protein